MWSAKVRVYFIEEDCDGFGLSKIEEILNA